jgi:hypothetical protein
MTAIEVERSELRGENKMRTKAVFYFTLLAFIVSVISFSSCSRLSGPSDAEVIKTIGASEFFTRGITLQPPIVVVGKGSRNKEGFWPVTVKVKFTYDIGNGQVSAPVEKTLIFYFRKVKDSAGKDTWGATLKP